VGIARKDAQAPLQLHAQEVRLGTAALLWSIAFSTVFLFSPIAFFAAFGISWQRGRRGARGRRKAAPGPSRPSRKRL